MFMVLLFSILTLLYCAGIFWLNKQWQQISLFDPKQGSVPKVPFISVIIPVRNEASNIMNLLYDLAKQVTLHGELFPRENFEVVVVDDHSEDTTIQLIEAYQHHNNLQLRVQKLALPQGFTGSHKKMAIAQAIEKVHGEIIVTTDGDCRIGARWLATISQFFDEKQPALVSGPVTFHQEKGWFQHLQTIEFASLIGTGAACLQAHRPTMCNGANLAFTKEAFYMVNGYEGSLHVPSGDDEFLMQKIFRQYPRRVFFLKSPQALVHTWAKSTFPEFFSQRRRWASKWKLHKQWQVAGLALFVFIFHFLLIITLGMTLAGIYPVLALVVQLLLKMSMEFFFLRNILHFMKKKLLLSNFLALEFIYSAYVVFFGICANFGNYTWKKRQYK